MSDPHATPDRAASIQDALELGRTLGRDVERERISLGIEGIDTHQIEGTPLRDVLVFREDVFKVIHGD